MAVKKYRQWRTLFLAVVAAATFAYSAIFHFDVPAAEILEFVIMSCILVGLTMLAAAVWVWLLRRLRR